jgi:hypothetical protein
LIAFDTNVLVHASDQTVDGKHRVANLARAARLRLRPP